MESPVPGAPQLRLLTYTPPSPTGLETKVKAGSKIDPEEVKKQARFGLKVGQIAVLLDCSKAKLRRQFATELRLGRAEFARDLRLFQYQAAKKGSPPLLIHLGKCELKQTNQPAQRRLPEPDVDDPMD